MVIMDLADVYAGMPEVVRSWWLSALFSRECSRLHTTFVMLTKLLINLIDILTRFLQNLQLRSVLCDYLAHDNFWLLRMCTENLFLASFH